jgi:hypothetical protein
MHNRGMTKALLGFALVLAASCSAQPYQVGISDAFPKQRVIVGDLTADVGQSRTSLRMERYSTAWTNMITTDERCDQYRVTIKYTEDGKTYTDSVVVRALRASDIGHTGEGGNVRIWTRSRFRLPFSATVTEFLVEKIRMEVLGTANIEITN